MINYVVILSRLHDKPHGIQLVLVIQYRIMRGSYVYDRSRRFTICFS